MLPTVDERCKGCNGYGIQWNEDFERGIDTIMDTQGLSYYDAVNQTKRSNHYRDDYWTCNECNGTGKKK